MDPSLGHTEIHALPDGKTVAGVGVMREEAFSQFPVGIQITYWHIINIMYLR